MMSNPKVSIIIPLYNKEKTIIRSMQSVLTQTYSSIEILVINDGSTDNSLGIVNIIQDERLHVHTKTNGGVSSARNYGVRISTGDFILFLDADDILYPNAVEVLVELSKKFNEALVFHSNYVYSLTNKEVCKRTEEGYVLEPFKDLYYSNIYLRPGNTLIKNEVFKSIGFFNEELSRYEDLEFSIRLIKNVNTAYTPKKLMVYFDYAGGESKKIPPLNKEMSYHIKYTNASFFESLVLSQVLLRTVFERFKHKPFESMHLLSTKFNLTIIIHILLRLTRKYL